MSLMDFFYKFLTVVCNATILLKVLSADLVLQDMMVMESRVGDKTSATKSPVPQVSDYSDLEPEVPKSVSITFSNVIGA